MKCLILKCQANDSGLFCIASEDIVKKYSIMLTDKHHKRIVNLFSIEVWLLFNLIFMIKLEL
jgi:hypothetical protein